MLDVTASDPEAFFASWQAARLARTDLKPMGAAGLTPSFAGLAPVAGVLLGAWRRLGCGAQP